MPHVNQFSSFQYAGEDDLIEQEDEDFTYSLDPSFQETYETELAEDPSIEVVPVVISTAPVPLLLTGKHRVNTTGPLATGSGVMPALSARRPVATTWQFEFDDLPGTETFTEPLVTTTGQFKAMSGVLPALPTDSPVTSAGQFKVISGFLPALSRPQPETRAGQRERNTSALPGNMAARQPGATTGQLGAHSAQLPIFVTTPSLASSLQAVLTSSTTGRIVVIPGSRKRKQAETEKTPPGERVSPRLRQGVTLAAALLFVVITSLLTLGPLASGQYPFPIFRSFNSWFRSNTASQQLSSHSNARQINASNLPLMQFPQSPYVDIAQQDAIAAGIPADYFVRQMNQESAFNPNAVSPAGAEGIAQFMPGTAGAAANLMGSYTRSYGGDYAMSLAAYNAGTGAVQHATYVCGSSWMNCLPSETRNYIYVIMGI